MVRNAVQVVLNHGVICCASGCELLFVMLKQWLLIVVCRTEPVIVNHGMLCCAKGFESWRVY